MLLGRMGCLLWILLSPTLAVASADSKPDEASRDFSYVEMAPAFIVNIGGSGRIGFLKVDVSLRVESTALGAVQQHMPALRHELIMRLSGQSVETLQSVESREALRAGALAAVQKIIQDEAGIAGITDLLFTSFMVQR